MTTLNDALISSSHFAFFGVEKSYNTFSFLLAEFQRKPFSRKTLELKGNLKATAMITVGVKKSLENQNL